MDAQDVRLPADTSQERLLDHVEELKVDPRFHGILVQLPLPDHIDERTVLDSLDPMKDVDGLHPENAGRLVGGRARFVPATPLGIQQMLVRTGHDPDGKRVVVCGRSEIVGKPVALLLMQRASGANATVTVCHTRTRDLADITLQADILIAAIGRPMSITADMVKEGVTVIDVGVNRIDAPERKRGYRLVGDVDFDAVSEKAAAITPGARRGRPDDHRHAPAQHSHRRPLGRERVSRGFAPPPRSGPAGDAGRCPLRRSEDRRLRLRPAEESDRPDPGRAQGPLSSHGALPVGRQHLPSPFLRSA